MLYELIANPILTGQTEELYVSKLRNDMVYDLSTANNTFAFKIIRTFDASPMPADEINTRLRVVFFQDSSAVSSILCKDFYAKEIAEDPEGFFSENFATDEQWVCPDVDFISLFADEKTFTATVMFCESAQKIDEYQGTTSYADKDGKQVCAGA